MLTTQYGVHDPERVARFALRALRQGNMTALEYDNAFRAILSEIPKTDQKTVIDLDLTGLRSDISNECSYNKITELPWTDFNSVSKKVLMHTGSTFFPSIQTSQQNPRPAVSAVRVQTGKRPRSTTVAAAQSSSKQDKPKYVCKGSGIMDGQRPPQGYNTTTGLGPVMPLMPDTAETVAYFHKLGATKNKYEWHHSLHHWNQHAMMFSRCQFCASRDHISTACPIKLGGLKNEYVIFPLIEKKHKGPAVMGSRGM